MLKGLHSINFLQKVSHYILILPIESVPSGVHIFKGITYY